MTQYFTVHGIADAKRALDELTKDLRRRVIRGALLAAAKPIVQAAKANAPVKTGLVRRSIGAFTSKIKNGRNGEYGVYIKPRAGRVARKTKNKALDPFYYRFQEVGFRAVGGRRVTGGLRRKALLSYSPEYREKLLRLSSWSGPEKRRLTRPEPRYKVGSAFLGRAFASQKEAAVKAFIEEVKKRIDLANRRK